jgi:quercetin dioxygenase-like cupin family protein
MIELCTKIAMQQEKISKQMKFKSDAFQVIQLDLPQGFELKTHVAKQDTWLFVQQGSAKLIYQDAVHLLEAQDGFLLTKDVPHALVALENLTILLIS